MAITRRSLFAAIAGLVAAPGIPAAAKPGLIAPRMRQACSAMVFTPDSQPPLWSKGPWTVYREPNVLTSVEYVFFEDGGIDRVGTVHCEVEFEKHEGSRG